MACACPYRDFPARRISRLAYIVLRSAHTAVTHQPSDWRHPLSREPAKAPWQSPHETFHLAAPGAKLAAVRFPPLCRASGTHLLLRFFRRVFPGILARYFRISGSSGPGAGLSVRIAANRFRAAATSGSFESVTSLYPVPSRLLPQS